MVHVTTTGLRERKKADTRAALADAVLRLAEERGFDHVTVEDVATAAGVSYRTFFNHFASKEEALLQPDRGPRLVDLLAEQGPDVPLLTALRAALHACLDRLQADGDTWRRVFAVVIATPSLLPRLVETGSADERELALAVAARTGLDAEADLHPGLVAAVVSTVLRVSLWRWHSAGATASLHGLLDEALDAVVDGLPTPTPRRETP